VPEAAQPGLSMLASLAFPAFDPVALQIGPLAIRWYALSYVVGLLLGWRYCLYIAQRPPLPLSRSLFDDFFLWALLGVILGGRVGYILFYNFADYLAHPLEILKVWHGGMSFHGGLIGVLIAIGLFARSRALPYFAIADVIAAAAPIGLLLGRIANFINGELYGRPTDMPWGVVFPAGGSVARHPSQLYEAALEGLLLFLILFALARFTDIRAHIGRLSGAFLAGYAVSRIVAEFFREPDLQLGFLIGDSTMGQWLSVPMLLAGLYLLVRRAPRPQ
jgi:phosphatidylglycerol:prolipoprotein diacylglycerol transferase